MFKINPKKLNFDQKILSSSSSPGDIFAYQNNEYDDAWMMKKISVDDNFNNLLQRVQEIVLGFNQSHHNILPISGYDIHPLKSDGWEIYLRLQRMKATLKDVLIDFKNKDQQIPETEILKYFHEAASGLEHLHNQKIAHRNVTLENAFLDKDGNVKLANFNLAAIVSDEEEFYLSQDLNGESQRQPPNQIIEGRDLLKSDVWCLGKMILELCLLSEDLVIEESDKVGISHIFKQLEEKYSKNLAKLLMKMLTFNLPKRINIHEVTQILQNRLNKEAVRRLGLSMK